MKKRTKWGIGLVLALALAGGAFYLSTTESHSDTELYGMCATCLGSSNCSACKNCKYCRHCAGRGGSCGVCR